MVQIVNITLVKFRPQRLGLGKQGGYVKFRHKIYFVRMKRLLVMLRHLFKSPKIDAGGLMPEGGPSVSRYTAKSLDAQTFLCFSFENRLQATKMKILEQCAGKESSLAAPLGQSVVKHVFINAIGVLGTSKFGSLHSCGSVWLMLLSECVSASWKQLKRFQIILNNHCSVDLFHRGWIETLWDLWCSLLTFGIFTFRLLQNKCTSSTNVRGKLTSVPKTLNKQSKYTLCAGFRSGQHGKICSMTKIGPHSVYNLLCDNHERDQSECEYIHFLWIASKIYLNSTWTT